MAGHSKWSKIKRSKGANDAKRGALFTKLGKNISVAARNGADPEMNAALRTAIDAAKRANLPKDNIERAILKGSGELPGVVYEEVTYEAYGPGGIAMIISCVTDNTNRTVSFVRSTLTKAGGSLGNAGSVLYLFEKKGIITIAADDFGTATPEDIEMLAIEKDCEDVVTEDEGITITLSREQLSDVADAVETLGATVTSAEDKWVTPTMITPEESDAKKLEAIIESLEENEDVNSVDTNADI